MTQERELKEKLFEALIAYADVYYRYLEEWDQLALLRDRARLAAHNGDWDAAIAASELAIEKAPEEREAHLLLAQALIQRDEPEDDARLAVLLADMLASHPEQSAPVFLLAGVHALRRGDANAAQLALQQSAAYYPKQADRLADMLDPYKMRSFLKRSREGNLIIDGYEATMLGAGFWSPDLELARMLFDKGDDDAARAKVLDHFARRRTQGEWDLILQDIAFCHELLGPRFWEIFPEESYLDLGVAPTLLRDGLALSVTNRSDRTLHNATLILCLQFTDMFPGTYVAIPAEATIPAVLAHDETSFGDLKLAVDVLGITKGVGDVVEQRAVLVSNEAVSWVDTESYKIAEADEFRRQTKATRLAGGAAAAPSVGSDLLRKALEAVPRTGRIEVSPKVGSDDVIVRLPSELAIVRPLFRLRTSHRDLAPTDNAIEGDDIVLRFAGVENFAEGTSPGFELRMTTAFGDVALRGGPQAAMTFQVLP
jgi:tetratricopeptide (TPR) repeat protein